MTSFLHSNEWMNEWTTGSAVLAELFPSAIWIQTVLDEQRFVLQSFAFIMVRKWYTLKRNHTSHFEFWSGLGLAICSIILSHNAERQQLATAPGKPQDHKGQQPLLYCVAKPSCSISQEY
jgi:hypothetical protein